jgi:hypothetical protein
VLARSRTAADALVGQPERRPSERLGRDRPGRRRGGIKAIQLRGHEIGAAQRAYALVTADCPGSHRVCVVSPAAEAHPIRMGQR